LDARSREIREVYDLIHASDCPEDAWHRVSTRAIGSALKTWVPLIATRYLNVGSGGFTYGVLNRAIDLDTSIRAVVSRPQAVVGDAQSLPFRSAAFGVAVCVGSVVNYVSLAETAIELWRVLIPGGILIVEYERLTDTMPDQFDLIARDVIYRGRKHLCWFYTDAYVERLLEATGFRILARRRFHILSHILARVGISTAIAPVATWLDWLLSQTTLARRAANAILLCRKPL